MTEVSTARDGVTVAPTADVDDRAAIGAGTRVWHLAQIREDATLGRDCNIGRGASVAIGTAYVVLGLMLLASFYVTSMLLRGAV